MMIFFILFFRLNGPSAAAVYTLSLHDALPISSHAEADLGEVGAASRLRGNVPSAHPPERGVEVVGVGRRHPHAPLLDRKSTRLNSSHLVISYAVFCLKKKNNS